MSWASLPSMCSLFSKNVEQRRIAGDNVTGDGRPAAVRQRAHRAGSRAAPWCQATAPPRIELARLMICCRPAAHQARMAGQASRAAIAAAPGTPALGYTQTSHRRTSLSLSGWAGGETKVRRFGWNSCFVIMAFIKKTASRLFCCHGGAPVLRTRFLFSRRKYPGAVLRTCIYLSFGVVQNGDRFIAHKTGIEGSRRLQHSAPLRSATRSPAFSRSKLLAALLDDQKVLLFASARHYPQRSRARWVKEYLRRDEHLFAHAVTDGGGISFDRFLGLPKTATACSGFQNGAGRQAACEYRYFRKCTRTAGRLTGYDGGRWTRIR